MSEEQAPYDATGAPAGATLLRFPSRSQPVPVPVSTQAFVEAEALTLSGDALTEAGGDFEIAKKILFRALQMVIETEQAAKAANIIEPGPAA